MNGLTLVTDYDIPVIINEQVVINGATLFFGGEVGKLLAYNDRFYLLKLPESPKPVVVKKHVCRQATAKEMQLYG